MVGFKFFFCSKIRWLCTLNDAMPVPFDKNGLKPLNRT